LLIGIIAATVIKKEAVFTRYSAGVADEGEAMPYKNAVNYVLQVLDEGNSDD